MDAARPRRALVVDAIAVIRTFHGEILESLGYEVREAADGLDALQQALAWQPEVAVLAIKLGRLDGWGLARKLRQDPRTARMRLIALTACNSEDDRKRSRDAGFDYHLDKPLDPDELKQVLTA
jgi:CheY-like chemotaxis protein